MSVGYRELKARSSFALCGVGARGVVVRQSTGNVFDKVVRERSLVVLDRSEDAVEPNVRQKCFLIYPWVLFMEGGRGNGEGE